MISVYAQLDKVILKHYFFSNDLSPQVEKKIAELAFPGISFNYFLEPAFRLKLIGGNIFTYLGAEDFESEYLSLTRPTDHGKFKSIYDPIEKSISCEFEGEFFIFNTIDETNFTKYSSINRGYISNIAMQDSKGKDIKKQKNDLGLSFRLEGYTDLNNLESTQQITLKIITRQK